MTTADDPRPTTQNSPIEKTARTLAEDTVRHGYDPERLRDGARDLPEGWVRTAFERGAVLADEAYAARVASIALRDTAAYVGERLATDGIADSTRVGIIRSAVEKLTSPELFALAQGAEGREPHEPETVLAVAAFAELSRRVADTMPRLARQFV